MAVRQHFPGTLTFKRAELEICTFPTKPSYRSHTARQLPGCQMPFNTQINQQLHFRDTRSSSISHAGVATGNGVLTSCLEVRSAPEPETD